MRRAFLVALSFANLSYLRVWSELLTYQRWATYLMVTPPKPVQYFAVMANVVLAAAAICGLSLLATRLLKGGNVRFLEMGVVLSLAIPLNALRSVLGNEFAYLKSPLLILLGVHGAMALGACLAAAGAVGIVFFHRRIAAAALATLAVLSPFCVVTFGQALWKIARYDATAYANKPPAPMLAGAHQFPRVLWFIADEWDYRLSFVDRNPQLTLPQIDRLRSAALHADHAVPPGPETPRSIPAYYEGRTMEYVIWDGPRELRLGHAHGDIAIVPWSAAPNVFERARALGANTALVEWFHPSCRILDGLSYCTWRPMAQQYNSMGDTFWQILPHQTRSLFETTLLSLFGQSLAARQQTQTYHAILAEAETLARDTRYAFTLVHLPVPHAPHAYNRRTGEFTLGNAPIAGYVDSLALLDRTVGEIRRSMEQAGTWDQTTVLFTSDHPYREAEQLDGKSDPRIPYILKLAGQREGLEYHAPFNAVLTGDLLIDVLRGQVASPAQAAAWLDRNREQSFQR